MWWKFMVNVGINQPSAVLRAPYGAFQKPAPAYALMMALVAEVRAVAAAEGVDLTEDDVERWHTVLAGQPAPQGPTSRRARPGAGSSRASRRRSRPSWAVRPAARWTSR
ncbi:MAG: hypothetical protein LC679_18000 [Intrasporangiaceae bacterium]|nr:hypothetical protein [Intrasporangiaceae bacterium]